MTSLTMNMEETKLDIINWINKIHDERILYKLEDLRAEQLHFEHQLTEEQKVKIMHAVSLLEEG